MEYYVYFLTETGTPLSQEGFKRLSKRWPNGDALVVQGSFLNDPEQFLKYAENNPPKIIVISLHKTAVSFMEGIGAGVDAPIKFIKENKDNKESTYKLLLEYMSKSKLKVTI